MSKLISLKNHYTTDGDIAIVFSNGKNRDKTFIVDVDKLDLIKQFSWRIVINKSGYSRIETSLEGGKKHILLGRLLMGFPIGKYVDHKDCDPLNNRMSNLRLATFSQNSQNASKSAKKRSSIYKGVSWHKRKSKWISTCAVNNKNKFLGYFNTELDAAIAYDKKAKELHGEFAKTNFP